MLGRSLPREHQARLEGRIIRKPGVGTPAGRWLAVGTLLALGGVVAVAVWLILQQAALGWDEAVYATKARALVSQMPASSWAIYRPPGLPVVGTLAALGGFSDTAVHLVSLGLGVAALGALWALGALMYGARVALLALIGASSAPVVISELPRFHNDLASAGLLLALMAWLWYQLEIRPAPNPGLLLAGPLAAAAFYLRYGTLAALVGIAVATVILWRSTLWRSRGLVAGTAAIAIALATPHLVVSARELSDPFGIVRLAADQVDTSDAVSSMRVYLRSLPRTLAGWLGVAYLACGAVFVLRVALQWRSHKERGIVWLALPAVLTAVPLVVISHAEARYLLFPLLLGLLVGAVAMTRIASRLAEIAPRLTGRWVAPAAWAILFLAAATLLVRQAAVEVRDASRTSWLAEAGDWIRRDAAGPCTVTATVGPVMAWYSGCGATIMMTGDAPAFPLAEWPGPAYVVFTTIDSQRKSTETVERYRQLVHPPPLETFGTPTSGAEVFAVGR